MRRWITRGRGGDDEMVASLESRTRDGRLLRDPRRGLPGDGVKGRVRSTNLHDHVRIGIPEFFDVAFHGYGAVHEKARITVMRLNRLARQGHDADDRPNRASHGASNRRPV